MSKPTLKGSKKRAWSLLSKIRRFEDAKKRGDGEYVKCVTCDKIDHWHNFHAGHFQDGGHVNATKFEEIGIHNQCVGCNMYGGGKQEIYTIFMIDTYGRKATDDLMALKHQTKKIRLDDYLDMIKDYKKRLDEYGISY